MFSVRTGGGLRFGGAIEQTLAEIDAAPLSEEEKDHLIAADTLLDWNYIPGGEDCPFEFKASDWGYLGDRLVAVDYSSPVLLVRGENY